MQHFVISLGRRMIGAAVLTNVAVGVHGDGWRCAQDEDE
jgi:hypothetical protein